MDPNNQQSGIPPTPAQPFPAPPMPPISSDPYSFIMDVQNKPKKMLAPNGGSFLSRLLLVAGIGTILILGIVLISSLINSGRENNTLLLTSLASEQTEIIRISELGIAGTANPDTLAFVQTTKSSLVAEQAKLLGYLASKKVKITPIELNSKKNKKVDTALISAKASNQFDELLVSSLKSSLEIYSKNLAVSYKAASNPESKALLSDSYKSTLALLK